MTPEKCAHSNKIQMRHIYYINTKATKHSSRNLLESLTTYPACIVATIFQYYGENISSNICSIWNIKCFFCTGKVYSSNSR